MWCGIYPKYNYRTAHVRHSKAVGLVGNFLMHCFSKFYVIKMKELKKVR